MNYWEECIASAFDDAGIVATAEQIAAVAADVEVSHENYGMAHGHNCIPNSLESRIDDLKRKHAAEVMVLERRLASIGGSVKARYAGANPSLEWDGDRFVGVSYDTLRR